MHTAWKTHLENAGAVIEDGVVVGFGNPEQERQSVTTANILVDLSDRALIQISGDDAAAFLQGQFSNDVHQLNATHSQLSAWCSPKGRVLASFRLFMRGDSYYMSLPQALADATLRRLRMFVLRSAVTLEDVSDQQARFGLAGPTAAAALAGLVDEVPGQIDAVVSHGPTTVVRIPGAGQRFEVFGAPDTLTGIWDSLCADARPAATVAWAQLDIAAGIPVVGPETSDAFVPQMINFELVGGVNFKKGCYPGQEVVARTEYLGKLKRRMFRAHIAGEATPRPGDELFVAGGDDSQSSGKIVNAAPAPGGGYDVLAVLQIANAQQDEIRLGNTAGPKVLIAELPYAIPNREQHG